MTEHQSGLSKEEWKQIVKEALQEWLDKQFAAFGKYSMAAVVSLAMVASAYIWLQNNGWHR